MASSYSTDLKLELMVTGENSGTWGDKTNTNLNLLQQAIAGYQSIALTSTNTTLSMTNATISNARNAVIKFTGVLSANTTVYVETGIEKTYIVENGTTGTYTLALNQVGGASVIWGTTDKTVKQIYLNGTDAVDTGMVNLTAPQTLTNKTLTSPTLTSPKVNEINDSNGNEEIKFTATASAVNELTVANAATGNAPEISSTGNDTDIDIKITPKGSGKVVLDGIKYPNTDGSSGQLLSTDGAGNLSFITVSSDAAYIAGSLPLATNKSTTARTIVSISKVTGQVGAYPVLNTFSSTIKTITTTSAITNSLDGSFAIIRGAPNATNISFIGVYTPSDGTPVIGNTSIVISANNVNTANQYVIIDSNIWPVSSDIFFANVFGSSYDGGTQLTAGGVRAFTLRVNTSGVLSIGNITTYTANGIFPYGAPRINTQLNTTTYFSNYHLSSTDVKVLTLSTNLTTINIMTNNQSGVNFATQGSYYNYGNIDNTYYYLTNSSLVFTTLNATTRLLSVPVTQSVATNFYVSGATWHKISNTRWLAEYQNATTLVQEIATFNVNATTLALTSINSTSRLYAAMTRFIGTTADLLNASTNLTTGILQYGVGTGYNTNTLELSTNGVIKGYNVGTYLGVPNIAANSYVQDPNVTTSVQVVAYYTNTSQQYKNLIVNAASTDQFNYCGVAVANDTTSPVSVIQAGIQDGYTGLAIGTLYYGDFDGSLTTVATGTQLVGRALTSTQLQIIPINI